MNKDYWRDFYLNKRGNVEPSLFAKWILNNYLKEGESLVELGCGNGRDSVFFSQNKITVLAIDQCPYESLRVISLNKSPSLTYMCADFTTLNNIGKFDNIYSRFTLHSINEEQEDKVIEWACLSLNKGGKLFIEVRGYKNELYKKGEPVEDEKDAYIYDGHYRRFLNNRMFSEKIEQYFTIIYNEEKKGFAPYGNEDHTFIRMVCEKK